MINSYYFFKPIFEKQHVEWQPRNFTDIVHYQGLPGEKGEQGDKGGPGIDGNIFRIKAESGAPVPPEYYIWIEIINTVLETTEFGDKGEPGPQVSFLICLHRTF